MVDHKEKYMYFCCSEYFNRSNANTIMNHETKVLGSEYIFSSVSDEKFCYSE